MPKYNIDYFYEGDDTEQYQYISVPYPVLKNKIFSSLSHSSKFVYSILLNKVSLSLKNGHKHTDEEGRVYVIYPTEEIMELFGVSKPTVVKWMKELEEFGLIERKKSPGFNSANRIYVNKWSSLLNLKSK
ncbi:DNA-binding MarR family transcriptional regulator [Clostridiales Family XIII bacterium PM5-7]